MARTVSDVLVSADGTLTDKGRVRYTEAERIGFVTDALNAVKNARPDLFLGQYTTAIGTLVLASPLPLDDQFFRPIVDYVIARCETKDEEHVVSGRAELMAKFVSGFLQ
jgi:hypothetical protein